MEGGVMNWTRVRRLPGWERRWCLVPWQRYWQRHTARGWFLSVLACWTNVSLTAARRHIVPSKNSLPHTHRPSACYCFPHTSSLDSMSMAHARKSMLTVGCKENVKLLVTFERENIGMDQIKLGTSATLTWHISSFGWEAGPPWTSHEPIARLI